jgi:hypothetical protein
MRRSDQFLIIRFLTWPAAWAALLVLMVAGCIVNAIDKTQKHNDICFGLLKYNLESKRDRNKLRGEVMKDPDGIRIGFTIPPCDFSGSKVHPDTLKLIDRIIFQPQED